LQSAGQADELRVGDSDQAEPRQAAARTSTDESARPG